MQYTARQKLNATAEYIRAQSTKSTRAEVAQLLEDMADAIDHALGDRDPVLSLMHMTERRRWSADHGTAFEAEWVKPTDQDPDNERASRVSSDFEVEVMELILRDLPREEVVS